MAGGTLSGTAGADASYAAPSPKSANLTGNCEAGSASTFQDSTGSAQITFTAAGDSCVRNYVLTDSTGAHRSFTEDPDLPRLRGGSALLDGMYAMALDDAQLDRATTVKDPAYNKGAPIPCPGGCYITGAKWPYVWTRDASYSADLGLTAIDPERMKNTLLFKLSDRRDGSGDTQIIQDTGTGGSYPASTDRVVWALGAAEILPWLPRNEQKDFARTALEAIHNTINHDRAVVFDPTQGLYMGEQSFLDWREQSYPDWTKNDPAAIGSSKALSTNVDHFTAISVAAELAAASGDTTAARRYDAWAASLKESIRTKFWLADAHQFSQMQTTALDDSAADRYDALGTSLAVLSGVASAEQAELAVSQYPLTPFGPPVFWPQQQGVRAYHNNSMWPFVSAYLTRAASITGNDAVSTASTNSMIRLAALSGSNMENSDVLDGSLATATNSKRQLWSASGMLSMVQQSFFGMSATTEGLTFQPALPSQIRHQYFPDSSTLSLENVTFHGKKLTARLRLPADSSSRGMFRVGAMTLDGVRLKPGAAITDAMLKSGGSTLTIELANPRAAAHPTVDLSDTEQIYGPHTPAITSITQEASPTNLRLGVTFPDEDLRKVTMDVLRDGHVMARGLTPTPAWTDTAARDADTVSYCYTVRLHYRSSGSASQNAKPVCWWGKDNDRVTTITADAFTSVGGNLAGLADRRHYANWGSAPTDTLRATFTPDVTGEYLVQTDAAAGKPVTTGITGATKMLRVTDDDTGKTIAAHVVSMPHTGSWATVRGSSYVRARLNAGTTYSLELIQDRLAVNMSYFSSNAAYNGAASGPSNSADIYAIKLLLVDSRKAASPIPTVTARFATPTIGGRQTITGSGFPAGHDVTFTLDARGRVLGSATATSGGAIRFTFHTHSGDEGRHFVAAHSTYSTAKTTLFTVTSAGDGDGDGGGAGTGAGVVPVQSKPGVSDSPAISRDASTGVTEDEPDIGSGAASAGNPFGMPDTPDKAAGAAGASTGRQAASPEGASTGRPAPSGRAAPPTSAADSPDLPAQQHGPAVFASRGIRVATFIAGSFALLFLLQLWVRRRRREH